MKPCAGKPARRACSPSWKSRCWTTFWCKMSGGPPSIDAVGDGRALFPMIESPSKESLYAFIRQHQLGVIATASPDGLPEAALLNIAATPDLELIFETTDATRKFSNLQRNPRAEMVIGWEGGRTLQCRGIVDEPPGREGERLKAAYLSVFPENVSHQHWPGNHYFRLRPGWVRLSDYNMPRKIVELEFPKPRHRI